MERSSLCYAILEYTHSLIGAREEKREKLREKEEVSLAQWNAIFRQRKRRFPTHRDKERKPQPIEPLEVLDQARFQVPTAVFYCSERLPRHACARHTPLSGSKDAVLNRPQRAQRGSLCVCQALHPAYIEVLVGPVTPQGSLQLATREIPHPDHAVISTTGQEASIRAVLERLDRPLMSLLHPHTFPTLQVP